MLKAAGTESYDRREEDGGGEGRRRPRDKAEEGNGCGEGKRKWGYPP